MAMKGENVYVQDADFLLLNCDVLDGLRSLEDRSVHCVVCSPPYWGLRDYSADGQLGLEPTPDLYVQKMVEVFQEVRRVLRDDGTCWVNLGDSYAGAPVGSFNGGGFKDKSAETGGRDLSGVETSGRMDKLKASGLKPKDLVGIPWRVAFALQADGWYLRSDIIWSKPNPMPESVTDRPTKAHEYVFLLSKSPRYFFDAEAVRESATYGRVSYPNGTPRTGRQAESSAMWRNTGDAREPVERGFDKSGATSDPGAGRNVRSVWEIATQPYPEAHFATYPEELVRRCVLAGTSERGCCPVCGKPWEREMSSEIVGTPRNEQGHYAKHDGADGTNHYLSKTAVHGSRVVTTLGWRPGCSSNSKCGGEGMLGPADPIPCTVLDPFLGSGTTAYVARKHGRRSVGIELNESYCELAARRMQQQSLFA